MPNFDPGLLVHFGAKAEAADHVIRSLRRKGWLERASWGKYLLIPPEHAPQALGESNVLALASLITAPYYIGYGTRSVAILGPKETATEMIGYQSEWKVHANVSEGDLAESDGLGRRHTIKKGPKGC